MHQNVAFFKSFLKSKILRKLSRKQMAVAARRAARTVAVANLPCGTEKIGRLYFHNDVNLFICSGLVILVCSLLNLF